MGPYYANVGPVRGAVFHGATPDVVDVFEAPDGRGPIGKALFAGTALGGGVLWRLVVHGSELPGRWAIVDREFRPTSV